MHIYTLTYLHKWVIILVILQAVMGSVLMHSVFMYIIPVVTQTYFTQGVQRPPT